MAEMKLEQARVAERIQKYGFSMDPQKRLMCLLEEVGELVKEMNRDSGSREAVQDELGDVLFDLLALTEALDMDAAQALDECIQKLDEQFERTGTADNLEVK